MQAIILAAGMGKRLKNLTAEKTKCMVEVNGVTLIERAILHLNQFPLSRIILVVGYEAQKLRHFVSHIPSRIPIVFVENPVYHSTNNIYSLFLAREHLLEEDTILLESDLIFDLDVLRAIIDDPDRNLALVAKYESWMDGTVVTLDEHDQIVDFLGKKQFKFCDVGTYYKTVNIYKFSKEFSNTHYVPFLEAYCKALGNNEYYEQVLKVISMLDNPIIKAKRLADERWYEIDDAQDLDIASSLFLESSEERMDALSKRYGGYWRYPKLIDFCYLVNPYFPPVRMYDELKANLERLVCDYPSGQAVQAILAANYFGVQPSRIVVGNGAAELIKALAATLAGKVGVIRPTFDEYPNRFSPEDVEVMHVDDPDFRYDSASVMHHFDATHISSLIIINPDNPSGNYLARGEMQKLIEWSHHKRIRLIVDESFMDFASNGFEDSLFDETVLERYPHLVLVKSISKSYGVPGLRLGVACSADADLIAQLKQEVSIWNINSFAEFYLQISEKYKSDYRHAIGEFKKTREAFIANLQDIPFLRVLPSEANFLMCEVLAPHNAKRVGEYLLEQHQILIKVLSGKRGIPGQYIRVAVKRREENDLLVSKLRLLVHPDEDSAS